MLMCVLKGGSVGLMEEGEGCHVTFFLLMLTL